MSTRIYETGVLELVGINEQVDQNDYSGAVSFTLPRESSSGEILGVAIISTEDGSGAVLEPTGKLFVFDSDPSIASGDTKIDQAYYANIVGVIDVAADDWVADDEGAVAYLTDTPVAFAGAKTLYFAFLNTLATAINSAAGDDEQIEMRAFIRLEN